MSYSGTIVTLQPIDYLIGPTQGDPSLCLSWPMALPPSSDGVDWKLGKITSVVYFNYNT